MSPKLAMPAACVEVNVGGHHFRAAASTLRKSPFFASLLADDLVDDLRDSEGRLFVDRDPELFAEVLRLLRGYAPRSSPSVVWDAIKAESDFYGVPLEDLRPPVEVKMPPDILTVRRLYVEAAPREAMMTEALRRDEVCMYTMTDLPPDLKSQTRIVAVEVIRHQWGSKTVFVANQQVLEEAGFCERADGSVRAWERTERRCYHAMQGGVEVVIPTHPMEVCREHYEHYVCVTYALPPVGHMVSSNDQIVGVLHPKYK